ncbi:hypothetical protein V3Q90_15110 [Flavobacterium oreochromis]|uniref:hypothetical protein n=1 Tax=Flavobacterium oreochromis TaxID=2906078 RepID=UPI00385B1F85
MLFSISDKNPLNLFRSFLNDAFSSKSASFFPLAVDFPMALITLSKLALSIPISVKRFNKVSLASSKICVAISAKLPPNLPVA